MAAAVAAIGAAAVYVGAAAGAVAGAVGATAATVAAVSAAATAIAAAAIQGAIIGAVVGGAMAAMRGENILTGALKGAAIGGVTAGVFNGIGQAVGVVATGAEGAIAAEEMGNASYLSGGANATAGTKDALIPLAGGTADEVLAGTAGMSDLGSPSGLTGTESAAISPAAPDAAGKAAADAANQTAGGGVVGNGTPGSTMNSGDFFTKWQEMNNANELRKGLLQGGFEFVKGFAAPTEKEKAEAQREEMEKYASYKDNLMPRAGDTVPYYTAYGKALARINQYEGTNLAASSKAYDTNDTTAKAGLLQPK